MNIEQWIAELPPEEWRREKPPAASEPSISKLSESFAKAFGVTFPDGYKRVIRQANGLSYNGMKIWPISPEGGFKETIFDINEDLQESFDDRFIYFAQSDEELYVFEKSTRTFCAIEFVGKDVWEEFKSSEEMFEFLLERAIS